MLCMVYNHFWWLLHGTDSLHDHNGSSLILLTKLCGSGRGAGQRTSSSVFLKHLFCLAKVRAVHVQLGRRHPSHLLALLVIANLRQQRVLIPSLLRLQHLHFLDLHFLGIFIHFSQLLAQLHRLLLRLSLQPLFFANLLA